jgi:phage protein D
MAVLSHRIHLAHGVAESTLEVWGQDGSVLMNREEKVRPFPDMSDSDAAQQVFADYGFTADVETSPTQHLERRHLLMQRSSDIQFLKLLARRNGFLACPLRGKARCHDRAVSPPV